MWQISKEHKPVARMFFIDKIMIHITSTGKNICAGLRDKKLVDFYSRYLIVKRWGDRYTVKTNDIRRRADERIRKSLCELQ